MSELVEIVTKDNKPIGVGERETVHQLGLHHRAVCVILMDKEGRILVQRRGEKKRICPLFWDLSVGEHLRPGEHYKDAALRGLKEELNVDSDDIVLIKIRGPHLQEHEYLDGKLKDREIIELYLAIVKGDITIEKSEEISDAKFMTIDEIEELRDKGKLTPWFTEELEWIKKNKVLEKVQKMAKELCKLS